jgi:hypothetical protein
MDLLRAVLLRSDAPLGRGLAEELAHVSRLADERRALVVPIFMDSTAITVAPPFLRDRLGIFYDDEQSWEKVAIRLKRALA